MDTKLDNDIYWAFMKMNVLNKLNKPVEFKA